jgi:hypothetical protein
VPILERFRRDKNIPVHRRRAGTNRDCRTASPKFSAGIGIVSGFASANRRARSELLERFASPQ